MATDKQIQAAQSVVDIGYDRYTGNTVVFNMGEIIDAAERAAWVSVKDGLPDRNCCVLVYEGRDGPFHAEYRTKTKKFHSMYVSEFDSFVYDHATHWMYEPKMEGE